MAEEPLERARSDEQEPPSAIVDLVFQDRGGRPGRRLVAAGALAAGLYALVAAAVLTVGPGLAPWSAHLAAQIHERSGSERAFEVVPPPPPPPALRTVTQGAPPREPPVRTSRAMRRAATVAPAQAAKVLTRAATEAPLDLTANTFSTAGAASFPGGASAGSGRSTAPVAGTVNIHAPAARRPTIAGPSRARPVTLEEGTWSCPWPAEADAEQIDEQTVVIRVRVSEDAGVERAEVVTDPGHGFGRAAAACARASRFQPARNEEGNAMAAWSPAIRVHFTR